MSAIAKWDMATPYGLYVGIAAALAVCKYSCVAEVNNTTELAGPTVTHGHHHGNQDNCTVTPGWSGHFSECPEDLRHYCVHGECRYIKAQRAPSCRCRAGYSGARCEYVILDWLRADKRHLVIVCVLVGLVLIVLLVVMVCACPRQRWRMCWRRRRRREESGNGPEKLSMMATAPETHGALKSPDPGEPPHTNSV